MDCLRDRVTRSKRIQIGSKHPPHVPIRFADAPGPEPAIVVLLQVVEHLVRLAQLGKPRIRELKAAYQLEPGFFPIEIEFSIDFTARSKISAFGCAPIALCDLLA